MTIDKQLRQRLCGVFTALVTPLNAGQLDEAALERHIASQLAAGVAGLVPVGTTGEAATLSDAETDTVIRLAVKGSAGLAFVLAGAGSNSTQAAIEKGKRAADLGVDGLLVVTPYYNKPSAAGIEDHFAAIAQAVDLPIMLYSVPGRTGVEITTASAARLAAAHSNIVGIKEAGGRPERVSELRDAVGDDFVIHSGDDALTLPFLALGADGVTSVASNIMPAELVALHQAWVAGDTQTALRIHQRLFSFIGDLFIESNPVPIKSVMALAGLMSAEVRAPLTALTAESQAALALSYQTISQAILQNQA